MQYLEASEAVGFGHKLTGEMLNDGGVAARTEMQRKSSAYKESQATKYCILKRTERSSLDAFYRQIRSWRRQYILERKGME